MSAEPATTAALEAAADWVDRLGDLAPADQRALQDWLAASDENARAFFLMRSVMEDPALTDAAREAASAPVKGMSSAPRRSPARERASRPTGRGAFRNVRWPVPAAAAGAAIAAAAAGVIIFGIWRVSAPAPSATVAWRDYATPVGARADATLSDRSVVHLDADSKVRVAFSKSAREVRLERGEAMFEVEHDRVRPFDVTAANAKVTAVGTVFDVDLFGDVVEVKVFRGVVKVAAPGGPVRFVHQGEWLTQNGLRDPVIGRFQPDLARSWRANWLQADQMPLGDVVARLNRYSTRPIVLRSAGLAQTPISGRFELSRPETTLTMLSALLDLKVAGGSNEILLSRRGGGN